MVLNLKVQRRMASRILGVGMERIWIDPNELDRVKSAVTGEDIKLLVKRGVIKVKKEKGTSRHRARERDVKRKKGRRRGHGRRKGRKTARLRRKEAWMKSIRPIRKLLKEMRDKGEIGRRTYRKLYLMAKGGFFRSKSHILMYVKEHELLEREGNGKGT